MRHGLLLPALAALFTLAIAVPAQATSFRLDSYSVSFNDNDPGLVLWTLDLPGVPTLFDLNTVGESFTTALFRIGTSEVALNVDDLLPKAIDVAFNFGLPEPGYAGSAVGLTGAAWFLQSFGYVVWDDQLKLAFGNTGLLGVNLSDAVFGLPGKADVSATFTLLRADSGTPAPVPEPSSLALLGMGVAALAAARKRRAI
jgi:hypothetical protein